MPPQFDPGGLLDQRYLLLEPQQPAGPEVLWLASDEVLGRRVALRLISDLTAEAAEQVLGAAAHAGAVRDGRWVRILDLGSQRTGRRRTVWLVSEWVEAPSLTALARSGPLAVDQAAEVARNATAAVVAAHAAALTSSRLDAETVRVGPGGSVRLTGLDLPQPLSPQRERQDVASLGALLMTAIRGDAPRTAAPLRSGLRWRPAAGPVRRWQCRRLARQARLAMAGEFPTARSFMRALGDISTGPRRADAEPGISAAWRVWTWRIVPPLIAVAIGTVGWVAGKDLGQVPTSAQPTQQFSGPGTTSTGTPRLVWTQPPKISSFDPTGGNAENPGAVGLAVDGDPSTAWTSGIYHSARFDGSKPGVGLLLDLRRRRTVSVAQILLSAAGASLQVRAGDHAPQRLGDLKQVAIRNDAPAAASLRLTHPTKARYWLVWFTALPHVSGGYQVGVAEVGLLR